MIKTINLTPPSLDNLSPEQMDQYETLKHRYNELAEKPNRTDAERQEMEELILRFQSQSQSIHPGSH